MNLMISGAIRLGLVFSDGANFVSVCLVVILSIDISHSHSVIQWSKARSVGGIGGVDYRVAAGSNCSNR